MSPMLRTALVIGLSLALSAAAVAADFATLLQGLDTRNFREKMTVTEQIAGSGHPRAAAVLTALSAGDLYVDDASGRVVIRHDDGPVTDAATGEPVASHGGLDRVIANILMRRRIEGALSRLRLNAPAPQMRLKAVRGLFGDLDENTVALLRERRDAEDDPRVAAALAVGLALYDLREGSRGERMAAIDELGGNLAPEARNALRQAAADGALPGPVREVAASALARTQTWVSFYDRVEQIFFGLSLGSVLLLAAVGLAITFGVMGVINMAHGELIMLGAYTTFVLQQLMPGHIGLALVLSVPAAFLVAGAFGVVIERGVIRHLYGRPLETLLATFGISLILQQLVRTVFSPLNRSVSAPEWLSGSVVLNPVLSLTVNRLVIIAFALAVFTLLVLVLNRTSLGLKVRAVSQNRAMARAVGVRSDWVDAATFGLGAGVAGIAGVALSQLTNVGPNMGQSYIIDSFLVVVFGGAGNLLGTLVGAMTLGVLNKFLEPATGAVLAKILVLVFIILFIQKRPKGLFPQRGRAAEA
ncbi:urea ABC transporter permease subunit UrtB [Arhodomonas sp. KWT2]|uniref:urea ABC transporter permease subunit UrtB n=1 Tax=unclassified Arhodomonas TaxID=2621637 RepID=UPI001F0950AB|nr:urea ABC transporter permease subunit UrtB [Arhodomonas sp. KWT]